MSGCRSSPVIEPDIEHIQYSPLVVGHPRPPARSQFQAKGSTPGAAQRKPSRSQKSQSSSTQPGIVGSFRAHFAVPSADAGAATSEKTKMSAVNNAENFFIILNLLSKKFITVQIRILTDKKNISRAETFKAPYIIILSDFSCKNNSFKILRIKKFKFLNNESFEHIMGCCGGKLR